MHIYIVAASDAEQDAERRKRWGDYWFKDSLGYALEGLGHTVTDDLAQAQVLINCHGASLARLPEWTFNVLWVIGHPDAVTPAECHEYDAVFVESAQFTEHLREQGVTCEHLPGASDFVPMDLPKTHDTIFVGNVRGAGHPGRHSRECIDALNGNYDGLEVWGEGWDWLPEGVWQGEYYPHEQLNELYCSSQTILNDTHTDMQRWGMQNPREYDLRAITGESVPTFVDCAERIVEVARPLEGLDIGCGARKRPRLTGVDLTPSPGVLTYNLKKGLPPKFREGLDVIVADNILEHINNLIGLMNSCRKALLPDGRMHIRVPSATTSAAFQDPTHVRYFVPETFDYFNVAHLRWREYGRTYGIKPWRVVYNRMADNRFIDVLMRPAEEPSA